jgi:type IV pilus assembly protein PilW
MLITLVIGSVLLAAITNTFINQRKIFTIQEQVAAAQQNVMAGLDLMKRDIMMAGYNPLSAPGVGILAADASSVRFTMDLNDDGVITATDDEDVRYSLYDADGDGDLDLGRDATGTGTGNELVAENIETLAFNYILADDTETTTPTAAERDQIHMIEVSLTARTANPDPQRPINGGYRTRKLAMAIQVRNMVFGP